MFLLLAITFAKMWLLKEMNGNVTSSIQYNDGSFCHCAFRKENRTGKRKLDYSISLQVLYITWVYKISVVGPLNRWSPQTLTVGSKHVGSIRKLFQIHRPTIGGLSEGSLFSWIYILYVLIIREVSLVTRWMPLFLKFGWLFLRILTSIFIQDYFWGEEVRFAARCSLTVTNYGFWYQLEGEGFPNQSSLKFRTSSIWRQKSMRTPRWKLLYQNQRTFPFFLWREKRKPFAYIDELAFCALPCFQISMRWSSELNTWILFSKGC